MKRKVYNVPFYQMLSDFLRSFAFHKVPGFVLCLFTWLILISGSQELCFFFKLLELTGDRGGTVVKVLYYKSEGRWFDPSWCHWKLLLT